MQTENHPSEEQLALCYYGEAPELEEHLDRCASCKDAFQNLRRTLGSVDSFQPPLLPDDYEARLWRSIRPRLPRRRSWFVLWFPLRPLAAAASVAGLAVVLLSRQPGPISAPPANPDVAREQILLAAVRDHLDRSQTVLAELSNAAAPAGGDLNIAFEQSAAADLLRTNRLYRQTAAGAGDLGTTALLEDLEQVLLEISHAPAEVSETQLESLRNQLEERSILFKVRVFGKQVEMRQTALSTAASL